jgi:hypothetical protein
MRNRSWSASRKGWRVLLSSAILAVTGVARADMVLIKDLSDTLTVSVTDPTLELFTVNGETVTGQLRGPTGGILAEGNFPRESIYTRAVRRSQDL